MTFFVFEDPTQNISEIHVGDTGTQLITTIYNQDGSLQDLSGVVSILFKFYSPSRVTKEFAGALYTDGLDGKIVYTTGANDFDEHGTWKQQCVIELAGGTWNTNIKDIKIYENIPDVIPPP